VRTGYSRLLVDRGWISSHPTEIPGYTLRYVLVVQPNQRSPRHNKCNSGHCQVRSIMLLIHQRPSQAPGHQGGPQTVLRQCPRTTIPQYHRTTVHQYPSAAIRQGHPFAQGQQVTNTQNLQFIKTPKAHLKASTDKGWISRIGDRRTSREEFALRGTVTEGGKMFFLSLLSL